jgi:hypothetical protein
MDLLFLVLVALVASGVTVWNAVRGGGSSVTAVAFGVALLVGIELAREWRRSLHRPPSRRRVT